MVKVRGSPPWVDHSCYEYGSLSVNVENEYPHILAKGEIKSKPTTRTIIIFYNIKSIIHKYINTKSFTTTLGVPIQRI